MENRNKEGNGAANPVVQILNLVAAGIMVPIPFIDANGNRATKYELRNLATAPTQPQYGRFCGGLSVADMLKLIESAYDKSNEFVMKFIEAKRGEDQLGGIECEKKLTDSIGPPRTISIGAQRLKPEELRLEDDSHAPRKDEREKSTSRQEQEMKQRYKTKGQEREDASFMTISDMTNTDCLRLDRFPEAKQ